MRPILFAPGGAPPGVIYILHFIFYLYLFNWSPPRGGDRRPTFYSRRFCRRVCRRTKSFWKSCIVKGNFAWGSHGGFSAGSWKVLGTFSAESRQDLGEIWCRRCCWRCDSLVVAVSSLLSPQLQLLSSSALVVIGLVWARASPKESANKLRLSNVYDVNGYMGCNISRPVIIGHSRAMPRLSLWCSTYNL